MATSFRGHASHRLLKPCHGCTRTCTSFLVLMMSRCGTAAGGLGSRTRTTSGLTHLRRVTVGLSFSGAPLRTRRCRAGLAQRQREPPHNRQVSVETDALDPTNAKHRERVVVLQSAELALDG